MVPNINMAQDGGNWLALDWRKMATYPSKQAEEDSKDKLDMMGNQTLLI
jgi:hypothetical protein